MITNIQQNTNPTFGNAKFLYKKGQKKILQQYLNEIVNVDSGLIPYFKKADGTFNMDSFTRQLKDAFDDFDFDGKYILDGVRKNKYGAIKAKLIHLGNDEKEITEDKFAFNPTHLLKPNKYGAKSKDLNLIEFFNNMLAAGQSNKLKKDVSNQYKYNFWDACKYAVKKK